MTSPQSVLFVCVCVRSCNQWDDLRVIGWGSVCNKDDGSVTYKGNQCLLPTRSFELGFPFNKHFSAARHLDRTAIVVVVTNSPHPKSCDTEMLLMYWSPDNSIMDAARPWRWYSDLVSFNPIRFVQKYNSCVFVVTSKELKTKFGSRHQNLPCLVQEDTYTIALTPRQYRSHILLNLGWPPMSHS